MAAQPLRFSPILTKKSLLFSLSKNFIDVELLNQLHPFPSLSHNFPGFLLFKVILFNLVLGGWLNWLFLRIHLFILISILLGFELLILLILSESQATSVTNGVSNSTLIGFYLNMLRI